MISGELIASIHPYKQIRYISSAGIENVMRQIQLQHFVNLWYAQRAENTPQAMDFAAALQALRATLEMHVFYEGHR
jgi:hypothetical protein